HITSRDLEFRYNEKKIFYRGDVIVVQGASILKSDFLTVTYEDIAPVNQTAAGQSESVTPAAQPTSAASRQRLKEVVAEGHVDITSSDRHATSEKAVFNELARTVVLTGKVILQENGNRVSGEKVT